LVNLGKLKGLEMEGDGYRKQEKGKKWEL